MPKSAAIRSLSNVWVSLAFAATIGHAQASELNVRSEKIHGSENIARLVFSGDVLFGSNVDTLTAKGKAEIDRALKRSPSFTTSDLIITGHADAMGDKAHNRDLAYNRADAVRKYILAKGHTIRIEVEGKGDEVPVKTCNMKLPRAELARCLSPNRRVEIAPNMRGG